MYSSVYFFRSPSRDIFPPLFSGRPPVPSIIEVSIHLGATACVCRNGGRKGNLYRVLKIQELGSRRNLSRSLSRCFSPKTRASCLRIAPQERGHLLFFLSCSSSTFSSFSPWCPHHLSSCPSSLLLSFSRPSLKHCVLPFHALVASSRKEKDTKVHPRRPAQLFLFVSCPSLNLLPLPFRLVPLLVAFPSFLLSVSRLRS